MASTTEQPTVYVTIEAGKTVTIKNPQNGYTLPLTRERIKRKTGADSTPVWIMRIRDNEWAIFPEFSGYGMLFRNLEKAEDDGELAIHAQRPDE
ncbi:MAG TPA: hypothetical protein VHO23_00860 [Candidatus Paceibacterota bacterium]|nr:hypothetical protein [Candidatus Paceibacterota bacterium]